ncbi:MAG: hypothetical protein JSS04_22230 [Proteobacteria bacterium]|nr:hypothetical protein [Pseudomonadota bacterium]
MFGLLLALAGVVLMSLFIAYECLCGRLQAERQLTVRSMFRFGFSRVRREIPAKGVAAVSQALADPRRNAPTSGEVVFEIGLVLAVHLAFAVSVVLTLDAYGVT